MTLVLPHELFDIIDKGIYKDKDAKNNQHFALMLVDKQFYLYFNKDSVWKNLFSLYFQPINKAERAVSIDTMKSFLRFQFNLQRAQKQFTIFRKINLLGYDKTTKKYAAKSHQTMKLRKTMTTIPFPSEKLKEKYIRQVNRIEDMKKGISRLKRTNAFKKNVKKDDKTKK